MWHSSKVIIVDENLQRSREMAGLLRFINVPAMAHSLDEWLKLEPSGEALCVFVGGSNGLAAVQSRLTQKKLLHLAVVIYGLEAAAEPRVQEGVAVMGLAGTPGFHELLRALYYAQTWRDLCQLSSGQGMALQDRKSVV